MQALQGCRMPCPPPLADCPGLSRALGLSLSALTNPPNKPLDLILLYL